MSTKTQKQALAEKLKEEHKGDKGGIASDVLDIAKYIITKCTIDERPINNEQLQIMLFLLQKESLHFLGMPLHHGVFQAWASGPVIVDVHKEFMPTGYLRGFHRPTTDLKGIKFIDIVVEEARDMKPMELHNAGSKIGGAWHTTWNKHKPEIKDIPLYLIKAKG